jgi:hypothetical protein
MSYPCERPIDLFRGPVEPCPAPAAMRLWWHYPARTNALGLPYGERWDEVGRYCQECGDSIVARAPAAGLEPICTATNRVPASAPRHAIHLWPSDAGMRGALRHRHLG